MKEGLIGVGAIENKRKEIGDGESGPTKNRGLADGERGVKKSVVLFSYGRDKHTLCHLLVENVSSFLRPWRNLARGPRLCRSPGKVICFRLNSK